jgi:lipid-binding SYLF domain-containing protein
LASRGCDRGGRIVQEGTLMSPLARPAALAAFVLLAASSQVARAQSSSEQQQLVDKARLTIEAVKSDASFGNAPELLRRARAVLIVPNLLKGGFFVGGEGGQGVLLASKEGNWSEPAFEQLFSASFGLQIGLEQAQVVMFAMTETALQGLLQDEFKMGAQAGVSVLMIGSNVQGATTPKLDADLIVWAKSQGAYAGVTLEGSLVKPNAANNHAYYGRDVTATDIVLHGAVHNSGADPLRQALVVR